MPFTGNVTEFVGRVPQPGGDLMLLWNYWYRKILVVEAVGVWQDTERNPLDQTSTYVCLENIQNLLDTVDFERGAMWAYLIDRPAGMRIIQRSGQHYCSPCDFLWAPRVDLSEIEITSLRFLGHGWGRGIWRGKKVDIQLACDDVSLKLIEQETRGAKAVLGMDLTYALVAHIFVGDLLFGLLTEPSHLSRPVRLTDRAVVFAALAKLERANMLHGFLIDTERMMIDENGQVRLLELHALRYYSPHQRKQLEEDAQELHWDRLREIFDVLALSHVGVPLKFMVPSKFMRAASTILMKTPSPERLLSIILTFEANLEANLEAYTAEKEESSRRRRSHRGKPKALSIGSLPPGPKQGGKTHGPVIGKTSRSVDSTAFLLFEHPLRAMTFLSQEVMLAPEAKEPLTASIVELA
ncbi:hypothetical protein C8R45DRAFT_522787 [Mycena sanguinolenta]|nr:hypothetical protein C8R45DRAFT_522787 [Mycena sanguinolenta]